MMHMALAIFIALAAPAIDGPKASQAGAAAFEKGHFKEAVASWETAFAAGFRVTVTAYNLACAQAKLGNKDEAFKWLDKLAGLSGRGFDESMLKDADLEPLRSDPRWKKTTEAMAASAWPCKHDSKNREFDFWIGDWNVVDIKGNKLGESHVELMLGQCIVYENWTGSLGGNGKSFNLWDAGRKHWYQTWVDDGGSMHVYEGMFEGGAIRYLGEASAPQGKTLKLKMTFTPLPDGRVRQLIEQQSADGKEWTTSFDGYYVKKT